MRDLTLSCILSRSEGDLLDDISICGAMANTFLFALGNNVGKSLIEEEFKDVALEIIEKAKSFNCNIILHSDVVCSEGINDSINVKHLSIKNISSNLMIIFSKEI